MIDWQLESRKGLKRRIARRRRRLLVVGDGALANAIASNP